LHEAHDAINTGKEDPLVPDMTQARAKAIISLVLALRGMETPNNPDDASLTRRFVQNDACSAPLLLTSSCFCHERNDHH
jgi:hypothetical protein